MRRFLLIFAILFLAPIIGHAATCTSTETVTKCAKISTTYEKIDYEVLSDTEYIIYFRSDGYGYRVPVHGIATETACKLTTAPFERSTIMPPVVPGEIAAKSCAEGSFFAINNLTASETDICPDGFFTMPYDVSCGAGMVDTANVPNCSDDTSGESCLIPATSAPAPEYKFTATKSSNTSGFSFNISAAGTFYVDWGDGNTETIEKPDTTNTKYSHNYSTMGTYTVKIGGLATAYNSSRTVASISFGWDSGIESVDGSLGAIFPTLSDGSQPSFSGTFASSYELTSIPENLFSGITGNAPNMFAGTFSASGITSIPENLFSGITGNAPYMFSGTFSDSDITSIPENLFSGITGAAEGMFESTFEACTHLTSIPENLFSGITGAAEGMFSGTFMGSYITSIPENLFSGITGAAESMFFETFAYCSSLTGPSARINGKYLYELWPDNVADWGVDMYAESTGLDDYACIPTVMGGGGETCETAPEYKFTATASYTSGFSFKISAAGTFYVDWGDGNTETIEKPDTTNTKYSHNYSTRGTYTVKIGGLATAYNSSRTVASINFVGASSIESVDGSLGAIFPTLSDGSQPSFSGTFASSYELTSIPENLFSGVTGAAEGMFSGTFANTDITSIPENLFSGITGAADGMFSGTFMRTSITSIPENLFAGITGTADGMFISTFQDCNKLTGPSARINGMPLYELWPGNVAKWGSSMYTDTTGLSDYACIPTVMGGGGETCAPAPGYKFSISAYDTSSFSFKISAAGTFYVDWGDGNTETIEKPDTTDTTYSHNYSTADTYTIKIGGLATAYNSDRTVASISFEDNMDIESIDGSLSAIFPTLSDGSQPSFYKTFFACYSLADIPETMFSGVTGNAPYMFSNTFAFCEGLTSIPENLFSGITGAAEDMFASTFMGCAGITNIPEKLFAGVTGSAPDLFNGTFDSCFSLTSIPENLFSGITDVADGMFEYTFQACNMLTGPSARINGNYLYELWPDNVADWGNSMYFDSTGLDDYACIPTVMGGGGETCESAPEYKFTATIDLSRYSDNTDGWGMPVTEFGFNLGAAGTFYVDWGDGNTETINKDNTDAVTYTHDYGTTSGTYTVKIDGLATDYSDDEYTPAISFYVDISATSTYSQAITAIFGSLGAIFPTLSDASQPRFIDLFYQSSIRAIPSGLFDGIHGVPVSNMFRGAFDSCNYLTSIPEKLFAGITGAAAGMFEYTFSYCSGLTGPSARINGKPLYELWPDNVAEWGSYMYDGATGLSDYACIPTDMGGGGEECEPTPEVLCTIGISQIKTSTGGSFALYAEKYTQPSLAIKYNDGICYGKLEQGNQSGTMNFNYNGTVYHLAN